MARRVDYLCLQVNILRAGLSSNCGALSAPLTRSSSPERLPIYEITAHRDRMVYNDLSLSRRFFQLSNMFQIWHVLRVLIPFDSVIVIHTHRQVLSYRLSRTER